MECPAVLNNFTSIISNTSLPARWEMKLFILVWKVIITVQTLLNRVRPASFRNVKYLILFVFHKQADRTRSRTNIAIET